MEEMSKAKEKEVLWNLSKSDLGTASCQLPVVNHDHSVLLRSAVKITFNCTGNREMLKVYAFNRRRCPSGRHRDCWAGGSPMASRRE